MLLVSVLLDSRLLPKPRMQVLLEIFSNVFLQERTGEEDPALPIQ